MNIIFLALLLPSCREQNYEVPLQPIPCHARYEVTGDWGEYLPRSNPTPDFACWVMADVLYFEVSGEQAGAVSCAGATLSVVSEGTASEEVKGLWYETEYVEVDVPERELGHHYLKKLTKHCLVEYPGVPVPDSTNPFVDPILPSSG